MIQWYITHDKSQFVLMPDFTVKQTKVYKKEAIIVVILPLELYIHSVSIQQINIFDFCHVEENWRKDAINLAWKKSDIADDR